MQTYTWIYSLKTPLHAEQRAVLEAHFRAFEQKWKSHGADVSGAIQIRHDRFVIVQAEPNEERPSGCSIDSMRKAVTDILAHYQIELLDASHVFYESAEGGIEVVNFQAIPTLLKDGQISADTKVFDHSLNQSDDLSLWQRPLKDTWMKRYLS